MLSKSQCFLSTVCRSVNIGITFEIPKDLEEYFGLPLKIRVMSFACDRPLATADVCAYHCPLLWNTFEPSIPVYSCSALFFIFGKATIMCRNLLFKLLCRVWRVIGCLYIMMYLRITCTWRPVLGHLVFMLLMLVHGDLVEEQERSIWHKIK